MIKQKLAIIVSLILFIGWLHPAALLAAEDKGIKWHSYDEGLALGKKENKKIFLHFYADWCHFCHEMKKKTFSNNDIIKYLNDHYVPVLINADNDKKLADNYFVRGLPATIFLDMKGDKIQLPWEENRTISKYDGFLSPESLLILLQFVDTEVFKNTNFKAYFEKNSSEKK